MDKLLLLCERSARGDTTAPIFSEPAAQSIAHGLVHAADANAAPRPDDDTLRRACEEHPIAGANAVARLWMSDIVSDGGAPLPLDVPPLSHELQCARIVVAHLADEIAAEEAASRLHELEKSAAHDSDAYATVMAAAWRAHVVGSANDKQASVGNGDALALARRGTRMARTESFPQLQYLAGMALARQRRLHGTPHLAARILAALLAVAGPRWRSWASWELLWVDSSANESSSPAVASLRNVFAATLGGDVGSLKTALDALEASPSMPPFSSTEPAVYRSCVLADPPLPFNQSRIRNVPLGLSAPASAKDSLCVALISPDGVPIRVFASALPLYEDVFPVLPRGTGHVRKESTICALAFATGMSLELEEAFRAIYGFAFLPDTHASTFRSMLHHVRAHLGDAADIVRDEGRLQLKVHRPFSIRDPLCEDTLHDRVLRVLAKRSLGAKRLAAALDLPLRSAQHLLGELVATGGCARQRSGNAVRYVVEDTTFAEPTLIGRED